MLLGAVTVVEAAEELRHDVSAAALRCVCLGQ
jgi:hypothetical protein